MREKLLRRRVKKILETDGPLSFEDISERIYGCEKCGNVTSEEHEEVLETIHDMHRDETLVYTVDRCVELKNKS